MNQDQIRGNESFDTLNSNRRISRRRVWFKQVNSMGHVQYHIQASSSTPQNKADTVAYLLVPGYSQTTNKEQESETSHIRCLTGIKWSGLLLWRNLSQFQCIQNVSNVNYLGPQAPKILNLWNFYSNIFRKCLEHSCFNQDGGTLVFARIFFFCPKINVYSLLWTLKYRNNLDCTDSHDICRGWGIW